MAVEVTRNVPGAAGLSLATVKDIPMTVRIPSTMQACTGGSNGATCILRCRNSAVAGPFGGCVPVMMEGAEGNAAKRFLPESEDIDDESSKIIVEDDLYLE